MDINSQAFFIFLKRKMCKAYFRYENFDKFPINHTFVI